jgi:hypothetical protein
LCHNAAVPHERLYSGIGLDEVLLLQPGTEGTTVTAACAREEVKWLLDSGLSMAEAVIPLTRPGRAEKLVFFDA